ncbi:MAG: hypothetical protein CO017_03035 [Zetaproteobacteria bacterium CG_4_8_14_3_um_filter_59_5]|nr:MAG: hypothetical protein CO017_03035 [Zetaproteobacteria bacterium CG_4_8_14_3_um_filter_59_5]
MIEYPASCVHIENGKYGMCCQYDTVVLNLSNALQYAVHPTVFFAAALNVAPENFMAFNMAHGLPADVGLLIRIQVAVYTEYGTIFGAAHMCCTARNVDEDIHLACCDPANDRGAMKAMCQAGAAGVSARRPKPDQFMFQFRTPYHATNLLLFWACNVMQVTYGWVA